MNVAVGAIELEVEATPPEDSRHPVLVLAHPHPQMGGTMHNKVIDQLFRRSSEKGWGVVRFNFRGVEKSTGTYDHGQGELEDFLGVLNWASEEFSRPISAFTLVGYSFGSWIVARAAATLPKIKKAILIAPPARRFDFSMLAKTPHAKHVFVAERDEFVSVEESERWFSSLQPPKTIQVIPNADHYFIGTTTELLRTVWRTLED